MNQTTNTAVTIFFAKNGKEVMKQVYIVKHNFKRERKWIFWDDWGW